MRNLPSALVSFLQSRAGFKSRLLVWVVARDPATGLSQPLGVWNGADDRVITIDGVARTYYGAGALLNVPAVTYSSDLTVRMQKAMLAAISPAVKQMIRGYDARFAPIEIHRAIYDNEAGNLVAPPQRLFKGMIDETKFTRPQPGSNATAEVSSAPSTRQLTLVLAAKRSDATQQLNSGDRIRRYIDVTGTVGVWWGQNRK